MIDEEEYNKIVAALVDFVNTSTLLWAQQKELNEVLEKQVTEHFEILTTYRDLVKGLRDQNVGFRALLTEHEERLRDIEEYLDSDEAPKPNIIPGN